MTDNVKQKGPKPKELRLSARFAVSNVELEATIVYGVTSNDQLEDARKAGSMQLMEQVSKMIDSFRGIK